VRRRVRIPAPQPCESYEATKGNPVASNEIVDVVMSSAGLGPESDCELYEYITDPSSGRAPYNMKNTNVQQ
jgi:hypothetical protein